MKKTFSLLLVTSLISGCAGLSSPTGSSGKPPIWNEDAEYLKTLDHRDLISEIGDRHAYIRAIFGNYGVERRSGNYKSIYFTLQSDSISMNQVKQVYTDYCESLGGEFKYNSWCVKDGYPTFNISLSERKISYNRVEIPISVISDESNSKSNLLSLYTLENESRAISRIRGAERAEKERAFTALRDSQYHLPKYIGSRICNSYEGHTAQGVRDLVSVGYVNNIGHDGNINIFISNIYLDTRENFSADSQAPIGEVDSYIWDKSSNWFSC